MKQTGQIIIVLILLMTVALAIGLSIVQKNLVDVSTASKVEQSSRAFSAAEAGVERALKGDSADVIEAQGFFSENSSQIKDVVDSGLIPVTPTDNTRQNPLEIPPLAKEEVTQIWLADLRSTNNPPDEFYKQSQLDVYWGNSGSDKAAVELTIVNVSNGSYAATKKYFDHSSGSRSNNFDTVSCDGGLAEKIGANQYQCYKRLDSLPTSGLMLLRARLLYNTTSQPFAVQAVGICNKPCSIPPQARIIVSKGAAGETERRVKVFQQDKVTPPFFDYAIFSAGEIKK